jgi:hypothetical protein
VSQFDTARTRIEDLLRELAADIGPRQDHDGGPINTDDPDLDPVDGALLTSWVMATAWVDPSSTEPFVVRISSANMATFERNGLLFEALYRMDD